MWYIVADNSEGFCPNDERSEKSQTNFGSCSQEEKDWYKYFTQFIKTGVGYEWTNFFRNTSG